MPYRGRIIMVRLPTLRTCVEIGLVVLAVLLLGAVVLLQHLRRLDAEANIIPRPNAQIADPALNARVEALLKSMTLDEKIGQVTQYSGGELTGPPGTSLDYDTMVANGQVGSLFNVVGAKATNHFQHLAVEKTRLHIPLLFGFDTIHGERTIFPVPLALAASFDPDLMRRVCHVAAAEAADDGVRWVFSPMVDIARDPRWGRITEGAGEDPYLGSSLAWAAVSGYQGDDLSHPDSVAACVKHFAAYGAPNAGREYNTVDMSELSLRQIYLPPYQAGVDAGAATVMSAFNPLNGVPATANPFTLTKILRQEWKFDGFVVSDYGAVHELINHGIAENGSVATRKAITSGVDMDMMSDLYRTQLHSLVTDDQMPESVLNQAVRRILRIKFALGLFEHPYADETKPAYTATPEKRTIAREAAEETIVLLRNDLAVPYAHPVLPIAKNTPTIALIGPLADSSGDMLGSWQGAGSPHDAVTLRAELQKRCDVAKTRLLYAPGTDILTQSTSGFADALAAVRQASVVVLALGESGAKETGESSSLTRLDLPGNQEDLLEEVMALNKPTVLVLFDGRPLAIKWAATHVPAIVQAWYPGIEAGPAVTDLLFGDTNFSAHLPATFPRAVGQEPLYYNQLPTGRPAENVDLTHPPTGPDKYYSRYIDETNAPLYPFGFGLSYTSFAFSDLKLSQAKISVSALSRTRHGRLFSPTRDIRVSALVKNAGSVAGTEVVQLYVRSIGGTVEEPVRELKGFHRVPLKPGESKRVEFTLGQSELAHIDLDMDSVVEPGEFRVWIGGDSNADLGGGFEVTADPAAAP